MDDPVAQTLLTLDTDRNGRIEPFEIAAYASAQGMDPAAATEEFSSIDSNGDGVLDSMELQRALGTATTKANPPSPAPVMAQTQPATSALHADLSQRNPIMPALADPVLPELYDDDSLRSSNTPSPTFVSAVNAFAQNAVAAPEALPQPLPQKSEALPAFVGNELLSDESVGGQESKASILAEDSRQAALTAAQRVSEQLLLEEKEERNARDLDRQAADIRSKSITLAKQTAQDALDAGAKAAHENADALLARITQLEDEAAKAEVKAAALRTKSKMEQDEADSFMAVANNAMQISPDTRV
jgi:hypothetical protein